MNYTFEQLPQAVNKLHERLDGIEKLLRSSQSIELEFSSELLTIQQASTFLNLSVPTLYSKVSRKEIPVNKKVATRSAKMKNIGHLAPRKRLEINTTTSTISHLNQPGGSSRLSPNKVATE